jgi:hypothetical protein
MPSAVDRLADALRRAEATWSGSRVAEWSELTESNRDEWRTLARQAATEVLEEVDVDGRRSDRVESGRSEAST